MGKDCSGTFTENKKLTHLKSDIKIYTSGSKENSHRLLTEINENGTIAKVRILVESDPFKHL